MKKAQDLSDRELQEGIFKYLRDISSSNHTINIWVTVLGIIAIMGLIMAVIPLLD